MSNKYAQPPPLMRPIDILDQEIAHLVRRLEEMTRYRDDQLAEMTRYRDDQLAKQAKIEELKAFMGKVETQIQQIHHCRMSFDNCGSTIPFSNQAAVDSGRMFDNCGSTFPFSNQAAVDSNSVHTLVLDHFRVASEQTATLKASECGDVVPTSVVVGGEGRTNRSICGRTKPSICGQTS